MNDSPQESTLPLETAARKAVDWVAKHWARVRLGHEGVMLDKIERQNRIVEVVARNAMTGKPDDTEGWPPSGDDSMGVDIGDTIHNHYYPASTETPAKEPASAPTQSKLPSLLKKAVITAALLGTGGGVGVAVPWLMGLFDNPAAVQSTDKWNTVETEPWSPPKEESEK